MISYLTGKVNQIVTLTTNRIILILEVNNIGYEIQIPNHFAQQLNNNNDNLVQIFTHFQVRDDQQILYGFATSAERDLFRQLISISGIGSQSAIALIDTLGLETLIQAIVTGNIKLLSKAPGVGQKTAERIALELKSKLAQWRVQAGISLEDKGILPSNEIMADLEMTLLALGYTNEEIQQAVSALSQDNLLAKNPHVEEWIRRAISFLSLDT
jgi:Holliday junction DNA helicase RuvA